jgi:hypothetical protein
MAANLALIQHGGRCPVCSRSDVPSLAQILNNCDATLLELAVRLRATGNGALVLANATLGSTADDLRCCLGLCRSPAV